MGWGLRFAVLGPLEIRSGPGGDLRTVAAGKQSAIIAALLLHANQVVSVDTLVGILWGGDSPATAHATLLNYIARLRQTLGPDIAARLHTASRGYRLEIRADVEADHLHAAALEARARAEAAEGRWESVEASATEGLALWRGEPLAHVGYDALRIMFLSHLEELRLRLRELRVDAQLALKQYEQVLPELTGLSESHPLRDPLHERRFVALYGAGRRAEAQALYRNVRVLLRDELGAGPSAVLRDLHQLALREAPVGDLVELLVGARRGSVGGGSGSAAAPAEPDPGPALLDHQFPPMPRRFVGRAAKLAELSAAMDGNDAPEQAGTVLLVGMAGVGKTALALTWAHQVAGQYPDGLLYVNLNGFAEQGVPLTTDAAVRILLDCLGVPTHQLPGTSEGRVALYHRTVAGKRLLLILDNARDADQVRPLLPRTEGFRVVVTSRHTLASLVTHLFARTVRLAPLTAREARDLLELRLGPERTAGQEAAVAAVAERCAHLPLALVVAAGRAWSRPDIPLDVLAEQLTAGLGALDDGDPAVSVRAVLSWSYRQLTPTAARMFRLLGLHPGPDVSVPAAAGLAAVGRPAAEAALTELVAMNMAAECGPGRVALHSLLREFAAERAADEELSADLELARERLFDSYLHTAISANAAYTTHPVPTEPMPSDPAPGSDVTVFGASDGASATKWFASEREVLANLVAAAAAERRDLFVWQVVCAQSPHLSIVARWDDDVAFGRLALRAARTLNDPLAEAHVHRLLGRGLGNLGDIGGSLAHLEQAMRRYEAAGDECGIAETHRTIASVRYVAGDVEAACEGMTRYLDFCRAAGHGRGEAMALNGLGWFHAHLGRYDSALTMLREALDLMHTSGDDTHVCKVWDSLGFAYHRRGDHQQSIAAYSAAIVTSQAKGNDHQRALGHLRIGDVYRDAGDVEEARRHWSTALGLLVERRWPEVAAARERLADAEVGRTVG